MTSNIESMNVVAQESKAGTPQQGAGQNIELVKRNGRGRIAQFMKSPGTVGTITGAIVLGAAVFWGALEAAIGSGAAYLAYRVLRKRARHA